jgi:hypothetical protein
MKRIMFILLVLPSIGLGQVYERTGKNLGLYLGAQGSLINSNVSDNNPLGYSFGGGLIHMASPGIYLKAGYHHANLPKEFMPRTGEASNQLHSAEGAILIDKRLLKLHKGRRIGNGCHYLSIGLILSPEYRYAFTDEALENRSSGEFSLLTGFSFTHIYKNMGYRNKSRTTQYDLFVRNGFTPYYQSDVTGNNVMLKRLEFGLSIRKIRHQVSNFLN